MIPHKKQDQSFISLPVSRVSSTQRLNHLNNPSIVSNPPTPGGLYISSSLNPNRNLPVTPNQSKTKEQMKLFEELFIIKQLKDFELALTDLSSSISSFKDEDLNTHIDKLIEKNDLITKEVRCLDQHQKLGERIRSLEVENSELNKQLKHVLKELIDYRAQLMKLPRLPANPQATNKQLKAIDIEETLKYAMKLSKFTKAPATASNTPFQIHPNNYIWPAEDALRRGMLALASLKADEIIKEELGEDDVQGAVIETKDDEEKEDLEDEKSSPKPPRRGSFGSYSSAPTATEQPASNGALDLDLFDPDEDDSD